MQRIKCLDGLRALSIGMVILAHGKFSFPQAMSQNFFYPIFSNSGLGVRIFFIISGYLITTLLIKEKEKNGSIDIKKFYIRRIFRIMPLFYVFIGVIILLKWFVYEDDIQYSTILFASIYLWNYKHFFTSIGKVEGWFFGHFWTLAIEEQFYLIWPFVFAKYDYSKLKKIVIIIIILMPIMRVMTYFLFPSSRGYIGMMLHTGGDAILFGCLGALMEKEKFFEFKILPLVRNRWFMLFGMLFLFICSPYLSESFGGMYNLPIGFSLNNLLTLFFLFWCMKVPTRFTTLLENKILMYIGVLSYSIYVWQQLFLTDFKNANWVQQFPQNLIIIFVVAFISYNFIEKPILKLKDKFKG